MRSIEAVLFGDVVGVAGVDLVWLVVLAVALVGGLVWWRREIAFVTVDAEVAAVHGVAAARFETALMVAVAATVIVSARVIGALLVAAMLVLPGATARLTAPSLTSVVRRAPLLGAACGATGMYVSWYADVPAGAAITLMSTMVFLVEFGRSDAARRRTVADADRHAEFV
jgi:ABC-type Mn2+/Zn2+ transport system permease subunit